MLGRFYGVPPSEGRCLNREPSPVLVELIGQHNKANEAVVRRPLHTQRARECAVPASTVNDEARVNGASAPLGFNLDLPRPGTSRDLPERPITQRRHACGADSGAQLKVEGSPI
jgi:hypothetical protein